MFAVASLPELQVLLMVPFVTMLLCIALLPFILKHHWEQNYHLVALGLAAVTTSYYVFLLREPMRVLREATDFFSFIALVGSLFVVAGGIHIHVRGEAKPWMSCAFLFLGGLLANLVGTTGASMLLIRPWIRMNRGRYSGVHTAFFIFVVSNIGGGLIPTGPPLFLGFLKGVPFWWVLQNCWAPWLLAMVLVVCVFFWADRKSYRRISRGTQPPLGAERSPEIQGLRNLAFLIIVLGAVFIERPRFLREGLMLGAAAASYFATPKSIHHANAFSFQPIKEVAWLFFGIFLTMIPVIDFMELHAAQLAIESPMKFFWLAGSLSSVLDNAPTYLTFLANALGAANLSIENPAHVAQFLQTSGAKAAAISLGAVLFGAATYIGNGPNFMVKAIASEQGVAAPGFFGFIFKYALPVLLPIFALISFLFFRS